MNRKLYHPLWVHVPAFVLLVWMVVAFIRGMPIPARVPMHFGFGGQVDRWGRPWEMAGLILLALFYILISILLDELWARQETHKRFNWLSLFDDITVAFLAVTFIRVLEIMREPNPILTLNWAFAGIVVLASALLALTLELARPYIPHPAQRVEPEDTKPVEIQIGAAVEEGRQWSYTDRQNPVWVNLAIGASSALLFYTAVVMFSMSTWMSVLVMILALI